MYIRLLHVMCTEDSLQVSLHHCHRCLDRYQCRICDNRVMEHHNWPVKHQSRARYDQNAAPLENSRIVDRTSLSVKKWEKISEGQRPIVSMLYRPMKTRSCDDTPLKQLVTDVNQEERRYTIEIVGQRCKP